MGVRQRVIDYSRGDGLRWFWLFYRLRKAAKSRLFRDIFTFFMSRSAHRHGGYIGPDTVFQGIPSLPHGLHGVFISRYAVIGKDCRIYQNVTIGEVNGKAPVIGDGCLIGAGAVIVGDIRLGDRVRIGAGTVVSADVAEGSTVVAQPPRVIERKETAWENPLSRAEPGSSWTEAI